MRQLKGKKLDSLINSLYREVGNGIQIDIFDISKVMNAARTTYANEYAKGTPQAVIEVAMKGAMAGVLAVVRKN